MVVIGQDVVTDIVTLPETNVIEENVIDMNVMQDVIKENEIDMHVMQDDLNDTIAADVVDVYDIDPEFVSTLNEHKYWVPNVLVDDKPKIDTVFNTFDDAYGMHKEYAVKARFSIRKSGLKSKKDEITHRYVLCNKAGKPRKTVETNTLIEDSNDDGKENENEDGKKTRRSTSTLTDCKARIGLNGIVGTNAFKKAHRLRVALLGAFDKVRRMPVEWNNFKRGMNKFIGEKDDTMKCNYDTFGDIVSFDATYDTNKLVLVLLEVLKSALYAKRTRERIMFLIIKRMVVLNVLVVIITAMGFCVDTNDPDKLKVFLAKVTKMKKELENDMPSHNEPQNKDGLYEDLLGIKAPDTVVIMNLNKCGNKGHRRFKSVAEKGKAIKKERMNQKVPFKHRECSKCGQMFHNKRTCDEKRLPDEEYQALLKNKKDAREVDVNESDKDEEDVKVDDVDEDDGR
nr:hypothetical protein [Tanacetum cinerariifolium]